MRVPSALPPGCAASRSGAATHAANGERPPDSGQIGKTHGRGRAGPPTKVQAGGNAPPRSFASF